jgi:hypothetical protein
MSPLDPVHEENTRDAEDDIRGGHDEDTLLLIICAIVGTKGKEGRTMADARRAIATPIQGHRALT